MEYIFLTTFYVLYFNHQLHITLRRDENVSKMDVDERRPSTRMSTSRKPQSGRHRPIENVDQQYNPWILLFNYLFSFLKFLPLPGFEPGTSPVPNPICYQLSYPGLDISNVVTLWILTVHYLFRTCLLITTSWLTNLAGSYTLLLTPKQQIIGLSEERKITNILCQGLNSDCWRRELMLNAFINTERNSQNWGLGSKK